MKLTVTVVALCILCGCAIEPMLSTKDQQIDTQCKQVISAIAKDIVGMKTNFTELVDFAPGNPVVMGETAPEGMQVQDFRITYYHEFEYVKGQDKTQSYYRPKTGGCIINIQLFPNGDGWQGFHDDEYTRNLDKLASKTGVRLQTSIQTQNPELTSRLQRIVLDRFKVLE